MEEEVVGDEALVEGADEGAGVEGSGGVDAGEGAGDDVADAVVSGGGQETGFREGGDDVWEAGFLDGAELRLVETAGGFLAIARDERERVPFREHRERGGNLSRLKGKLLRNGAGDLFEL